MILRLQDSSSGTHYDFVELCGSELAAIFLSQQSKQGELIKKFATSSFNSLSMILTKQD